jgi:hypothetical protein
VSRFFQAARRGRKYPPGLTKARSGLLSGRLAELGFYRSGVSVSFILGFRLSAYSKFVFGLLLKLDCLTDIGGQRIQESCCRLAGASGRGAGEGAGSRRAGSSRNERGRQLMGWKAP